MRRSLQILSVLLAVLLAVRMMAQDTGAGGAAGGSGGGSDSGASTGTTSPDTSGASGAGTGMDQGTGNGGEGATNGNGTQEGTTNGNGTQEGTNGNGTQEGTNGNGTQEGTTNGGDTTMPQGGGEQGQGGTGTGGLMGPGTENPETGGGLLEPVPEPGAATEGPAENPALPGFEGPPPGSIAPIPGTTPAPTPVVTVGGGTQGAVQTPPVTFTLPGGYGGSSSQSFTLGQGRLAKPPVTFTATVSQGYDNNLFDAPSHVEATPTPIPGPTPGLERRIVDYIITPPFIIPVFQYFRGKAAPTATPPQTEGLVGSAVSTLNLGAQVQSGSPRTVFTMDLSLGVLDYWQRPGGKIDYNGSFDLSMVHRITPRATLSVAVNAVYSKTPNFSLINTPTNNSAGAYLNGDMKADLTYNWSSRIATVTSYDLGLEYQQGDDANDFSEYTFGTQLRYTASSRNTITAEIRDSQTVYTANTGANNGAIFYILGLDSYLTSRIRNTFGAGIEDISYATGPSQTLPYFESATTLSFARGAGLSWTNRIGAENSGAANETASSYRTGLTFSEPFSTKLVGSASIAYNYYKLTDDVSSAGSYINNEFEGSVSLGYNISPRFSLSLSYTYTDLGTTQVNAAYTRQQIYLGGTYTFY